MRWLLGALVVLAAVFWWFFGQEAGTFRHSRDTPDRPTTYESRAAPETDRKEPGKPGESPVPAHDEPDVSYVPIRCRNERGTPVAGLTVVFGRSSQLRVDPTMAPKTDARGRSTVRFAAKPGSSMRVHVYDETRHGYEARSTATTRRAASGEPVDLVIHHPVDRLVRVLDLDERPVPDATLTVCPDIPEDGMISAIPGGWKLTTSALGECVVTAQPGVPYSLEAHAKGFVPDFQWGWTAPEDSRTTVIELAYALTVRGSVTLPGAGPLAQARVELKGPEQWDGRTDANGRYSATNLLGGEYRVMVTDERGHVRAIRRIMVLDDMQLDPIEARPLVERRCEILDADRDPARGAYLRFEPGPGIVKADDAGRIRFEAAAVRGLWLIIGADRCGRRWIPIGRFASPVVLPREAVVNLHLSFGPTRPDVLLLEYGPPGRPRIVELLDVGDDAQSDRVLAGLPPGPLDIDLMGQTKRVNLLSGETTDVSFHIGK